MAEHAARAAAAARRTEVSLLLASVDHRHGDDVLADRRGDVVDLRERVTVRSAPNGADGATTVEYAVMLSLALAAVVVLIATFLL